MILYCIILCCIIIYCMRLYGIAWYFMTLCCVTWYWVILYTIQYNATQHNTSLLGNSNNCRRIFDSKCILDKKKIVFLSFFILQLLATTEQNHQDHKMCIWEDVIKIPLLIDCWFGENSYSKELPISSILLDRVLSSALKKLEQLSCKVWSVSSGPSSSPSPPLPVGSLCWSAE